ncbi:MAG: hypothetical protein DRI61_15320, partial [Chloroflexi bacterium]
MRRLLICFSIALFLISSSFNAYSLDRKFGDIGKPADYAKTIKRFRSVISDFETFVDQLPSSYDWRDYGAVTPAKDQGSCGSCWAFTSVGVLESKILIAGGDEYDLSEQQQISCNISMYGCCGGNSNALKFWYTTGPMEESCTGYGDYSTNCNCDPLQFCSNVSCDTLSSCSKLPYHTTNYYTVDTSDIGEMKASLMEDGPAYFRFDVYDDFLDFWDNASPGDVYTNASGSTYQGGHAVLLIGWDDSKGAWLCKNSWGENAGPNGDGTFWIAYSGHANDLNFGMANVEITSITGYGTIALLHHDGAIWRSDTGWNLNTPPYYPDTGYAVRFAYRPDGSYVILHKDGALYDSVTGWITTNPPYYPNTGYARGLLLKPEGGYKIVHRYGCIFDSSTGWLLTTPPYYPGVDWVADAAYVSAETVGYRQDFVDNWIDDGTGRWSIQKATEADREYVMDGQDN